MKHPFGNSFPLKTSNPVFTAEQKFDSFKLFISKISKKVNVICKTDSKVEVVYTAKHSSNI